MSDEASFVLRGRVSRDPKTGQGGRGAWAFFSVEVRGERGTSYVDVGAFDDVAEDAGRLRKGSDVTVHGRIGVKKITEADRNGEVHDRWIPNLVAEKITSVLAARKPEDPEEPPPPDDDSIPF